MSSWINPKCSYLKSICQDRSTEINNNPRTQTVLNSNLIGRMIWLVSNRVSLDSEIIVHRKDSYQKDFVINTLPLPRSQEFHKLLDNEKDVSRYEDGVLQIRVKNFAIYSPRVSRLGTGVSYVFSKR